jgi:hypothetical protein
MKHLKPRSVFIFENMDKAKSIFNKKVQDFEKLKTLLQKNLGYIGKFTEYLLNDNIPYSELESMYNELIGLQKRQSPIDINKLSYEKVLDKIQTEKEDIKIKEFLNLMPSEQKNYTKKIIEDWRKLVLSVANSPNLERLISKISRYKSYDDMVNAFKIFAKPIDNSKEAVKGELSNLGDSKIVYEGENLLVVLVGSWEDIRVLGRDTSWCIVPSKNMFKQYAEGRLQYIIYDYSKDEFDPKFKIGLTLEEGGEVYVCHDILDGRVSSSSVLETLSNNGIGVRDILPKFEPIEIDISKIGRNSNFEEISKNLVRLPDDKVLELLKKVSQIGELRTIKGRVGDKERGRSSLIQSCYNRLFGDRDWVLSSEMMKISKEVGEEIIKRSWKFKNLVTNEITYQHLNDRAFIKGLEIWKDSSLKDFEPHDCRNLELKKETKGKLLDRLKKIMNSGYSKPEFVIGVLLLSKELGRLDEIENWQELVKKHRKKILDDNLDFDLEFSLDEVPYSLVSRLGKEDVKRIIKKDYSNIYFSPYNISFYEELINHLSENNIGFRASKENIKLALSKFKLKEGKLSDIIRELGNLKRKVSGHTITKDNVSVTII